MTMTGRDLLAFYAQLAATVSRMLELARTLQWAQLPRLEARCAALFAQLHTARVPAGFSAAERARFEALTARIRQDQQALAALVQPQLLQLVQRVAATQAGR